MSEHEIDSKPVWKMDSHQPFHRWTCSCGAETDAMFNTAEKARKAGLEHAAAKSDTYTVGDITISRTVHNHGWTVTRNGGELVLIGGAWEPSAGRSPKDVMRYFAHLDDALEAAEQAWAALEGER